MFRDNATNPTGNEANQPAGRGPYNIVWSNTNDDGDYRCCRQYHNGGTGYYTSNDNGTYSYRNADGSTYKNDGNGAYSYRNTDGSAYTNDGNGNTEYVPGTQGHQAQAQDVEGGEVQGN